jgi:hypothetical protein
LAAVIRNEVNPVVVHTILLVEDWRGIRIAAAASSTVATTASHTLTSRTVKIATFGTGRDGAYTAIAAIVDSIAIGAVPGGPGNV